MDWSSKFSLLGLLLCLNSSSQASSATQDLRSDPEEFMNVSEIIRYHGYPVEEHTVETKDGFLLAVQRIPSGRHHQQGWRAAGYKEKQAVFLQHGLLSSSADWVTNLPNQSLGFVLADAGYDVWLGNVRGNTYSRKHVKYKTTDREFWDWSWDEMSRYDVPAMLDYVISHTNNQSLYYIGHSQGTAIAFAAFSNTSNTNITTKVKAMFALAPVTTVKHIKSPIRYLAPFTIEIELLFLMFGVHDFLPSNRVVRFLARHVCDQQDVDTICSNMMFLLCGYDRAQLNVTRLPVYYSHSPAGTSVRNIVHFAQMVRSGKFQMFDYGLFRNWQKYGQIHAPVYNLNNMLVPTAVFLGDNDWLADPTDAKLLLPNIRRQIGIYNIPNWDHLDFIWGLDAKSLLYDQIIKIMKLL